MQKQIQLLANRKVLSLILLDLLGVLLIYFVPTLTHLISLPVYFIEPMRLMLILAMVHTNKHNAYFLALTLPLFSFLISSHPVFLKVILISIELVLNVWLFYLLKDRIKQLFSSILLSIVLSKLAYYTFKFVLIKLAFLDSSLISTPLVIQLCTTLVFSLYLYKFFRKNEGISTL